MVVLFLPLGVLVVRFHLFCMSWSLVFVREVQWPCTSPRISLPSMTFFYKRWEDHEERRAFVVWWPMQTTPAWRVSAASRRKKKTRLLLFDDRRRPRIACWPCAAHRQESDRFFRVACGRYFGRWWACRIELQLLWWWRSIPICHDRGVFEVVSCARRPGEGNFGVHHKFSEKMMWKNMRVYWMNHDVWKMMMWKKRRFFSEKWWCGKIGVFFSEKWGRVFWNRRGMFFWTAEWRNDAWLLIFSAINVHHLR